MSHPECSVDLTKPHITDYTEYEFMKIIDGLYDFMYGDEWQAAAEVMFERTIKHPDGLSLVYDGVYQVTIIENIREWYKEQGLPFLQPDPVIPITDYTEKEFMQLLVDLHEVNGTEEHQQDMANRYKDAVEHPDAWAIMFGKKSFDSTPESVITEIKRWYKENNKPCFKPE